MVVHDAMNVISRGASRVFFLPLKSVFSIFPLCVFHFPSTRTTLTQIRLVFHFYSLGVSLTLLSASLSLYEPFEKGLIHWLNSRKSKMDKSWMHLDNKLSKEFELGVKSFIDVAKNHVDPEGKTPCPCRLCINANSKPLDVVESHLYRYGIARSYQIWAHHGEKPNRSKHMPNSSHVNDNHGKLTINFSTIEGMPICKNASKLASECGTIVRSFAPLQVKKWSNISEQDKMALIERVEDKFEIDTSLPCIKKFINVSMAKKYSNYRSAMYGYFTKYESAEVARQNRYRNVSQENWEWLCDLFNSESYKERSITNSANRAKVPYIHRAGSRSFPCHRKLKKRAGEQPSRIQIFHDTHYSEVTGWFNDEARSRYEQMVDLKQQSTLEGSTPREEDEICNEVLGKKSRLPPNTTFTSSTTTSNEGMDELRMMVMTQDEKIQSQTDEIQQYKDKLKKMEDDNESFRRMVFNQIGLNLSDDRSTSPNTSHSD